ncbi:hypothetical protein E1295_10370 [Nonomuraea mesophila]|uniref:TauD/TfdA-like domain-containing protein n=1 Tax=Nonomuraea mesophila TaxID=2530382 RepID=A0A4R5FT19_9ACTN|nr:TauD/TfdA family dioxygenase [Nonomuraea mesophila]TDE56560.1 hypothetical protein E1295_10370 [Nonomuraea mesophila]
MSFGVVPARVDGHSPDRAGHLLAETGAVILTGLAPTPDALVVAAALVLGHRLRQVFPYRSRPTRDSGPVHLHADSFDVVVDVGGVPARRRDPDEDYVFIQAVRTPDAGGESFVADAYRFADNLQRHDPDLWDFLTGADVDLYGAWANVRGLPATPRVGRHVEYTRTGRRIVRRVEGAVPLHRDPDAERTRELIGRFDEAVQDMHAALPRFTLAEGETLVLDNYRCWHGRDAHTGERHVRILTVRSADAR